MRGDFAFEDDSVVEADSPVHGRKRSGLHINNTQHRTSRHHYPRLRFQLALILREILVVFERDRALTCGVVQSEVGLIIDRHPRLELWYPIGEDCFAIRIVVSDKPVRLRKAIGKYLLLRSHNIFEGRFDVDDPTDQIANSRRTGHMP